MAKGRMEIFGAMLGGATGGSPEPPPRPYDPQTLIEMSARFDSQNAFATPPTQAKKR